MARDPGPMSGLPIDAPLPARPLPSLPPAPASEFRLGEWPAELQPEFEHFLDYWLSKHESDGRLPSRAAIDPSEIPILLPGIALIDVEPAASAYRFKFRLLGTRHSYVTQRNMAGRYVDDMIRPEHLPEVLDAYTQVVERKLPHYWSRTIESAPAGLEISYERVIVPLSQDGETVNMLFGYWIFNGASDNWHWWRDSSIA
jgi:hypothetical protein